MPKMSSILPGRPPLIFKVVEDKWKRPGGGFVSLELVMQPEHVHQAQRHLEAIKAALAYFDKHLGKYPFPNLTIVDPPFHAQGSFGMEYPNLYYGRNRLVFTRRSPVSRKR